MGHKPLLRHRAYIRYFSLLVITFTSDTTCIHSSMITLERGKLPPFYLALNWPGTTSSQTSLSTITLILKWKNIGNPTIWLVQPAALLNNEFNIFTFHQPYFYHSTRELYQIFIFALTKQLILLSTRKIDQYSAEINNNEYCFHQTEQFEYSPCQTQLCYHLAGNFIRYIYSLKHLIVIINLPEKFIKWIFAVQNTSWILSIFINICHNISLNMMKDHHQYV